MARRNTVNVQPLKILELSAEHGWSAATLSKRVGKHERWLSEVKRGKNLPSPEEAAKMCILLDTKPEEILVEAADIELVRNLIAQEFGGQSAKKPATSEDDGLTERQKQLITLVKTMDEKDLARLEKLIQALMG